MNKLKITTDDILKCKDEVARDKGYPSWAEMEDFLIDHNSSVVVAVLIGSAMGEVVERIERQDNETK